jgi:hypothetical protein
MQLVCDNDDGLALAKSEGDRGAASAELRKWMRDGHSKSTANATLPPPLSRRGQRHSSDYERRGTLQYDRDSRITRMRPGP